MTHEVFWSLGWYDWTLWMWKIYEDRKRHVEGIEIEWERQSYLLALIANTNRDSAKRPNPFLPTDFFTPSWKKEVKSEEQVTEDVISKYPKRLK